MIMALAALLTTYWALWFSEQLFLAQGWDMEYWEGGGFEGYCLRVDGTGDKGWDWAEVIHQVTCNAEHQLDDRD